MPASDRINTASNNGKTLRPTLASSRTNKAPLTPKLATAPSLAPSSARSALSVASTASRSSTDPATPYSNNVTPRSSSRKSRASSTHSTPTGTPDTPTAHRLTLADTIPRSAPGSNAPSRPRSIVGGNDGPHTAPVLAAPGGRNSRPSSEVGYGGKDSSSMFFHANEARRPEPTSNPGPKVSKTFFYANGAKDGERSVSAGLKSPLLPATEKHRPPNIDSKFFHANTIPNERISSPLHSPPVLSATPEPYFHPHPPGKDGARPPSPHKDTIHLSYRKGASQVIRPNGHSRPASAVSAFSNSDAKDTTPGHRRRSSAEHSGMLVSHHKSSSMSSIDSICSNRKISGISDHSPSPLHVDVTSPSTVMSESTNAYNEGRSGKEPNGLQSPLSLPQSPALQSPATDDPDRPPQTALQKMNELAANARRERKVMDLEISNSSLLAINRQLEREVRKQKAELKRFRRMSRNGGMASTGANRNSILGALTEGEPAEFADEEFLGLEGEDDEEDDEEEPEELSSSESSIDEGTLSPSALAERDAKYRFQDQKRLQLDLSKHKELLIDSQKMNQSLKRCLTVTEDLIKEGRKALDYRIRVSDVKLGGRILSPEDQGHSDSEDDDEMPHGGSLLSPWTHPDATAAVRASVEAARADRDSGIDLQGPKPPMDYFNGHVDSD